MAIDWTTTGAAMQGWASLVQAGAAIGLLWIGWRGVDAWRRESIYQRKIELADAALVSCYQVADILRQMSGRRGLHLKPIVLDRRPNEPTWLWHTREAFAFAEHVHADNASAFQSLRVHRHRAQAVFGEAHASKLDELQAIAKWLLWESMNAISIAEDIWISESDTKQPLDPDELAHAKQSLHESRILFAMSLPKDGNWMDQDNRVGARIDESVRAIEVALKVPTSSR